MKQEAEIAEQFKHTVNLLKWLRTAAAMRVLTVVTV